MDVAATAVADASDIATDDHLWSRNYFGLVNRKTAGYEGVFPHMGPAWGGGPAVRVHESVPVGSDSAAILRDLAGYSEAEAKDLFDRDTVGELSPFVGARPGESNEVRVQRGELSRVEPDFARWSDHAANAGRSE